MSSNAKSPFTNGQATTGAGFVAPKTLDDTTALKAALVKAKGETTAAPVKAATTTITVAQGGYAMEITVPTLAPEAAAARTLEVHAAARARNARNDALRAQKRLAL